MQRFSALIQSGCLLVTLVTGTSAAPVTIPKGTDIHIRTMDKIESDKVQPKQTLHASVAAPIITAGKILLAPGADCLLTIEQIQHAGRLKGRTTLELQLTSIQINGKTYPLLTRINEQGAYARIKDTGKIAGAGAATGAIIGALAGGGAAWKIGALAGAGAGTWIASRMPQKTVVLPAETQLVFTLREPMTFEGERN